MHKFYSYVYSPFKYIHMHTYLCQLLHIHTCQLLLHTFILFIVAMVLASPSLFSRWWSFWMRLSLSDWVAVLFKSLSLWLILLGDSNNSNSLSSSMFLDVITWSEDTPPRYALSSSPLSVLHRSSSTESSWLPLEVSAVRHGNCVVTPHKSKMRPQISHKIWKN